MRMIAQLEGWKEMKKEDIGYLECPFCGYCHESILMDDADNVTCRGCKRIFNKEKLKMKVVEEDSVVCGICGTDVSITPGNFEKLGGFGYMCPKCFNIVAVRFKKDIFQPEDILRLDWNKEIKKYGTRIYGDRYFSECKSKKDYLVLKILQLKAKDENSGFLYIKEKEQKGGLLYDIQERKYIGYIVWMEKEQGILRQMYIVKDERRKGYGTQLMELWVDTIALKISEDFGFENPNEKSQSILVNLGYAEIEGDCINGIKCFFVRN